MNFEKNVFINCPFDKEFRPLLEAAIFTVLYLKFEPRLSKTRSSADVRISEIIGLIQTSKYSIHDISRCEPLKDGELPRFNMPYEMGLDIGCSIFGNEEQKTKQCLILEKNKNSYDAVISDISGQDIKEHNDKPKKIIEKIIEWFAANDGIEVIPSASQTYNAFIECKAKVAVNLAGAGYTPKEIRELKIPQLIKAMKSALA